MDILTFSIIFSLIIAAGGFIIKELKVYSLIAGYNTATNKQKKDMDIKHIANILGIAAYICSALCLALGFFCRVYLIPLDIYALISASILFIVINIVIVLTNKPIKPKTVLFLVFMDLFVALVMLYSFKTIN